MDAIQQTDALNEGRRIYVGNLRYSVTPTDIETVLREVGLGNFEKIHISVDPISERNPGYCFVEFPSREAAEQALVTLEGIAIYDRALKVGPCHPKTSSSRKPYDSERPAQDTPLAQRWGDWRSGAKPVARSDRDDVEPRQSEVENVDSKRLYVGGLGPMLNQEQNDAELREIFTGFEIAAVGKRITPHPSATEKPGNHHYAFLDFPSAEEAEKARRAVGGMTYQEGRLRVFHAKARAPVKDEDLLGQDSPVASPMRSRSYQGTASPAGKVRTDRVDRADRVEAAPRESREERDGRQRVIMASNNWRRGPAAPAAE